MNIHNPNNPSRPRSVRLAPFFQEDQTKDIHTLGKEEQRIIETALTHYIETLDDTALMMKGMGHLASHRSCIEEKFKTKNLLEIIQDCWQVDVVPQDYEGSR